jgi:hypothetical protein
MTATFQALTAFLGHITLSIWMMRHPNIRSTSFRQQLLVKTQSVRPDAVNPGSQTSKSMLEAPLKRTHAVTQDVGCNDYVGLCGIQ